MAAETASDEIVEDLVNLGNEFGLDQIGLREP